MIFTAGVLISFVVYLIIGFLVGRNVKDESDYFVAGRNAPTLLVMGSLVASYLTTNAFMGEVGFAYDGYPIMFLILVMINVTGYVLGVLTFGRYLRRSEALTVPEFFRKRFDSKALQAVGGFTIVIGLGAYLVAVTQGISLIVSDLSGINYIVALLLVWISYTAFTFFAGSPGVLVTDTIMFFVFLVAGVLGMSWVVMAAGGPSAVMSKLSSLEGKPDILSWHGVVEGSNAQYSSPLDALVWVVLLGIVWATIVAVSPWQSSRYLMCKNEHVALRSGLLSLAAVLFIYPFLMVGGAAVNLLNPDLANSELTFVWAAQNVLPIPLGILGVTGIVAAGLSSATTFLSLIGFSTAHDIAPAFRRSNSEEHARTDAAALRFSRINMLIVGVVVLAITAVAPPALLAITYFAATLFAASWGPVAILSIFSDRITKEGAIIGMIAGFVGSFIAQSVNQFGLLELPTYAHPVILGFLASLIGIFIGNRIGEVDPAGVEFRRALSKTPEVELDPKKVKTTLRLSYVAAASCVVVIVLLIVIYFLPYSQAIAGGG